MKRFSLYRNGFFHHGYFETITEASGCVSEIVKAMKLSPSEWCQWTLVDREDWGPVIFLENESGPASKHLT
jgi:hypothetical protein